MYYHLCVLKQKKCARVDFPPAGSYEDNLTVKACVCVEKNPYKFSTFFSIVSYLCIFILAYLQTEDIAVKCFQVVNGCGKRATFYCREITFVKSLWPTHPPNRFNTYAKLKSKKRKQIFGWDCEIRNQWENRASWYTYVFFCWIFELFCFCAVLGLQIGLRLVLFKQFVNFGVPYWPPAV